MSSTAMCSTGADFDRRVEVIIPIDDPTEPLSRASISTMTVGAQTGSSPIEDRSKTGPDRDRSAS